MSVEELDSHSGSQPLPWLEPSSEDVVALDAVVVGDGARPTSTPLGHRLWSFWRRIPQRRTVVPLVLLAFVGGVVVGVGAANEYHSTQVRAVRENAVDIELTQLFTGGTSDGSEVTLRLRNDGPLPVEVIGAGTAVRGISVVDHDPERAAIPVGEEVRMHLELSVDCILTRPGLPAPISVDVRTASGRVHDVVLNGGLPQMEGPIDTSAFYFSACLRDGGIPITPEYAGKVPGDDPDTFAFRLTIHVHDRTGGPVELRNVELPLDTMPLQVLSPVGPVRLARGDPPTTLTVRVRLPGCVAAQYSGIGTEIGLSVLPASAGSRATYGDASYFYSTGVALQRDLIGAIVARCPRL